MDSVAIPHTLALLAAVAICCLHVGVYGACTKPTLGTNSYTLSEDKSFYNTNETYEIYCIPGYITSTTSNLVCLSSNVWSTSPPVCIASEGTYPWWLLLVAVLMVVLLVSCILPRFIQCILGKKPKKKNDIENNDSQRNGNDDDDSDDEDYERSNSPVPDFTKNKNRMNNMEFMSKLHKDVDRKSLKRANKNAVF